VDGRRGYPPASVARKPGELKRQLPIPRRRRNCSSCTHPLIMRQPHLAAVSCFSSTAYSFAVTPGDDARRDVLSGPWPLQDPGYADAKSSLHSSLRSVRQAMLSKLDGLSEYDVRRPLTPTGTNLLGLIKHLSIIEAMYFGETFGRPIAEDLRWWDGVGDNATMWATEDESRAEIVDNYRRAWAHADATIDALALDSPGRVSWWTWPPGVVLFNILVHVLAETNRHAGHADILREQLDGEARVATDNPNLPRHDVAWWAAYRARVERAARAAKPG
jgi:Protein of unknown function (DUF664)